MEIPLASNEDERLAALYSYGLLDTDKDDFCDRMTSLTATALNMPVSLISLVDRDRIWFKSAFGLDTKQIPRDANFCSRAIQSDEIFEIEDTQLASSSGITDSGIEGIRYYASAPLIDPNGYRLGTLCVLSQESNKLSERQRTLLRELAKVVVDEMLLWHTRNQLEIETQNRLQVELAAANREKLEALGIMVGGVAHDLNNLLVPIVANAEYLSETVEPEMAGLATEIKSAGFRAAELCSHLLTFAGQKSTNSQVLRPDKIVAEGIKRFTDLFGPANVEARVSEQLPAVTADFSKLAQVIVNLLSNAVEASGDESKVIVNVSVEYLTEDRLDNMTLRQKAVPGEYVCMTVVDNGEGMDEATLRRAFDPFFTTKSKGTGMGLSFVAGLLRSNYAPILLTSNPGSGTCVQFWLLASEEECQVSKGSSVVNSDNVKGSRLLLVDDDDSVRCSTSTVLELWGFEVKSVASGNEAIELFQNSPDFFDLAIVDLFMPVVDGLAVVKYLKLLDPDFPVIISTGNPLDGRVQKSLDAGAATCLCKPFTKKHLKDALTSLDFG